MGSLDTFAFWRDPDFRGGFEWYRDVSANRKPAKFLIARAVPVTVSLESDDEEALWQALEAGTTAFLALWDEIRYDARELPPPVKPSLLDLCRALAYRMLAHCNFCRWDCRVDAQASLRYRHRTLPATRGGTLKIIAVIE